MARAALKSDRAGQRADDLTAAATHFGQERRTGAIQLAKGRRPTAVGTRPKQQGEQQSGLFGDRGSGQLDLQRRVGFAGSHNLVVAFEEFGKSDFAGGRLEEAALINICGEKLPHVKNVNPVCQLGGFEQKTGSGHAVINGQKDWPEAHAEIVGALPDKRFAGVRGNV